MILTFVILVQVVASVAHAFTIVLHIAVLTAVKLTVVVLVGVAILAVDLDLGWIKILMFVFLGPQLLLSGKFFH